MSDDGYDWFARDIEDRAFAEFVDSSRTSHKKRIEALARLWDPRSAGWHSAPDLETLEEWVVLLGEYDGVLLERQPGPDVLGPPGSGWTAHVEHEHRSFRADYPSLASAVAAIRDGSISGDLKPDSDDNRWKGPDLADVAYRGGAPGLGKGRSRGRTR
jgi:hypothetical protein